MFFGDSLTEGPGLQANERFTSYIEEQLKKDGLNWRVINAGRSGDTIKDGLNRIESDLNEHKPDVVFICLGGNDFLKENLNIDCAKHKSELLELVDKIQARNIKVFLTGITPPAPQTLKYMKETSLFDLIKPYSPAAAWGLNTCANFLGYKDSKPLAHIAEFFDIHGQIRKERNIDGMESIFTGIPESTNLDYAKTIANKLGALGYNLITNGLDGIKQTLEQVQMKEFFEDGYFLDAVHPNQAGHEKMGESISTFLKGKLSN